MTFNKFLEELEKKLKSSDSYPMTKRSLNILRNSRYHKESDENVIYDAINNDTSRNNDPLSLRGWWNEKKLISKYKF
jgi:hypothetical protein